MENRLDQKSFFPWGFSCRYVHFTLNLILLLQSSYARVRFPRRNELPLGIPSLKLNNMTPALCTTEGSSHTTITPGNSVSAVRRRIGRSRRRRRPT